MAEKCEHFVDVFEMLAIILGNTCHLFNINETGVPSSFRNNNIQRKVECSRYVL